MTYTDDSKQLADASWLQSLKREEEAAGYRVGIDWASEDSWTACVIFTEDGLAHFGRGTTEAESLELAMKAAGIIS